MSTTYAQRQTTAQKKDASSASSVLDNSSQSESLQRKADMANNATQRAEAPRPNNTGMPDNLKAGIESLSGFSMDDVRVHYNSSKPATVQALAYTQGTDIHVAPGQEKHLPHEAWHVAQQMAGRVSPTTNINGMPVNDNAALEHEADVMGEKVAGQMKKETYEKRPMRMDCEAIQCANIKYRGAHLNFATLGELRAFNEVNYYWDLSPYGELDDGVPLPDTLDDVKKMFDYIRNYKPPKIFDKKGKFDQIDLSDSALVKGSLRELSDSCDELIESIALIEPIPFNEKKPEPWRLDNQNNKGNYQIQLNNATDKMKLGCKVRDRNGKSTTIACVNVKNERNMNKVSEFKQALRESKNDGYVYSDE